MEDRGTRLKYLIFVGFFLKSPGVSSTSIISTSIIDYINFNNRLL